MLWTLLASLFPKHEDRWDFDTDDLAQPPLDDAETQAVYDAYGSRVEIHPKPDPQRRRKPPPNLQVLKAPLQKVFDPHTISNYHDHVEVFYSPKLRSASSDLPLRDNFQQPKLRESLIDLDVSTRRFTRKAHQTKDPETIRPAVKPILSGKEGNGNRTTRDWTFPIMSPLSSDSNSPCLATEEKGSLRSSGFQPEERISCKRRATLSPEALEKRASAVSLIDLDASLAPDFASNSRRPSTTESDGSSVYSDPTSTPFELDFERNNPIVAPFSIREPSLYIPTETSQPTTDATQDFHHLSDGLRKGNVRVEKRLSSSPSLPTPQMPPLPMAPNADALEGLGSNEGLKDELQRMIESMSDHLKAAGGMVDAWHIDSRDGDPGANLLHD